MTKVSDLPWLSVYYNDGIRDMSFVVNGNTDYGDYVTGQFTGEAFVSEIESIISGWCSSSDFTSAVTDCISSWGCVDEYLSEFISSYASEGRLDDYLSDYISDHISDYISSYISDGNIDDYLSDYLSNFLSEDICSYIGSVISSSDYGNGDVIIKDSNSGDLRYLDDEDFAKMVLGAIYYDEQTYDALSDSTKLLVYDNNMAPMHYIPVGALVEYIKENL